MCCQEALKEYRAYLVKRETLATKARKVLKEILARRAHLVKRAKLVQRVRKALLDHRAIQAHRENLVLPEKPDHKGLLAHREKVFLLFRLETKGNFLGSSKVSRRGRKLVLETGTYHLMKLSSSSCLTRQIMIRYRQKTRLRCI